MPLNWIHLIICCLRKSLLQNFLHEFLKFVDSFILVSDTKRDNNVHPVTYINKFKIVVKVDFSFRNHAITRYIHTHTRA